MGNNNYWEENLKQRYATVSDEDIVSRIKKCQLVIDKIDNDELWNIIMKDVQAWTEDLDNQWQYAPEDKLQELRVLKHACVHIKNLKDGYVADWKIAQEELERRNNPDIIERDMEN